MIADFAFTLPGILLVMGTGEIMAARLGYSIFQWGWLAISFWLFVLTGLIWLFILLPSQRAMIRETALSITKGELTAGYRKAAAIWTVFGIIATLIPLVILFLMLTKSV